MKATDPAASNRFENAIRLGIAGNSSEMLLRSGEGNAPLMIQVLSVNPTKISTPQQISILVYIWDSMQRRRRIDGVLERLYGFTLSETRLAAVLATGTGLNMAADQLGISLNTARNQLQKMFAKTRTHRRSEFLVRIMGILEY